MGVKWLLLLLLILAFGPVAHAMYVSPNLAILREKMNDSEEYQGDQMYRETFFISSPDEDTETFEMVVTPAGSAPGFPECSVFAVLYSCGLVVLSWNVICNVLELLAEEEMEN